MAIVLLVALASCKGKKSYLKSPPGYDFQNPTEQKLEQKIKEISGLVWDPARNVFLAHFDESGVVFELEKEKKQIVAEYRFAKKGDFEDIALVDETPYVLRSDGTIFKVERDSAGAVKQDLEIGKLETGGNVDFETMYYDSTRKALILICKNCKVDDNNTVSAYAYYLDSAKFDNTPVYKIDAGKIREMAPKKTSKLQPSAARIQPVLKKLFIISSAANLLVVADLNGNVESVHWLKPKMFPQPEGLAFNKTGDMYISNEGVTGPSTILSFPSHGEARKQR